MRVDEYDSFMQMYVHYYCRLSPEERHCPDIAT